MGKIINWSTGKKKGRRSKRKDKKARKIKSISSPTSDGNNNYYGSTSFDSQVTYTDSDEVKATNNESSSNDEISPVTICAILSTAFSYGTIMTTLFLLTLPLECKRIEAQTSQYDHYTVSKSLALGGFAAIAGLAQLITPLIGMLSDNYTPNQNYPDLVTVGNRIPYVVFGALLVTFGFAGMMYASAPIHPILFLSHNDNDEDNNHDYDWSNDFNTTTHHESFATSTYTTSTSQNILSGSTDAVLGANWFAYTVFFALANLGLNAVYTITIAFLPDLIPSSQIGVANGTFALMVVIGSLVGFAMFHLFLGEDVIEMYKMYIGVSLLTTLITFIAVLDRNATLDREKNKDNDETIMIHNYGSGGVDEENPQGKLLASSPRSYDTTINSSINSSSDNNQKEDGTEASYWMNTSWPQPNVLLYELFYKPISTKTFADILSAYWLDTTKHRDFFIVTISRFFYYMGISSQTFFLYYIHDALQRGEDDERNATSSASTTRLDPESAVALLAIVGQASGALTCYPIGILSDQYFGGRRKPFVYGSCVMLALGNLGLLDCTSIRQMLGVGIWLGAANGMYLTMDTSLAVDTLKEDEEEEKEEDGSNPIDGEKDVDDDSGVAQMLGVWGVFGFVGSAMGPLIGGIALLTFSGDPPNDSSTTQPNRIETASQLSGGEMTIGQQDQQEQHPYYSLSYAKQEYYTLSGYEALFSLSAFYFFCSAAVLTLVRKKSV